MTVEDRKNYLRAYRKSHDSQSYQKAYREARKEEIRAYNKVYRESHKKELSAYKQKPTVRKRNLDNAKKRREKKKILDPTYRKDYSREYARKRKKNDPSYQKEYMKKYHKKRAETDPEYVKKRQKYAKEYSKTHPSLFYDYYATKKFGIPGKELKKKREELVLLRGEICWVCGRGYPDRKIVIDHNHNTNEIRGLLCSQCNSALGLLGDRSDLIMKMHDYILVNTNLGSQ